MSKKDINSELTDITPDSKMTWTSGKEAGVSVKMAPQPYNSKIEEEISLINSEMAERKQVKEKLRAGMTVENKTVLEDQLKVLEQADEADRNKKEQLIGKRDKWTSVMAGAGGMSRFAKNSNLPQFETLRKDDQWWAQYEQVGEMVKQRDFEGLKTVLESLNAMTESKIKTMPEDTGLNNLTPKGMRQTAVNNIKDMQKSMAVFDGKTMPWEDLQKEFGVVHNVEEENKK